MSSSQVTEAICEFVMDELVDDDTPITPQTHLLNQGLVDSMNLVRLLDFLERQFNTQIPVSSVNDENFASVESIAGLVTTLQNC